MAASEPTYREVDEVTIYPDRFDGCHSGGAWLAYPCAWGQVPAPSQARQHVSETWWIEAADAAIGRGITPSAAYRDLLVRLARREPDRHATQAWIEPGGVVDHELWIWDVTWPGGGATVEWDLARGITPAAILHDPG